MIERKITPFVKKLSENYPIVTMIGPRQSGKTTLARHLFPEYDYISLEDPDVREELHYDIRAFLARHAAPAIFDEVQRVPELASYLQTIVDKTQRPGMYILTGSHQPMLRETVSQSLAGRTGLVDLLPLSIAELRDAGYQKSRETWMLDGFMPRLTQVSLGPTQLYRDYFRTYIERDARSLINLQYYEAFERFIRLLAGRVGQVLNLASLANESGVSAMTIKAWLKVLEASFIIFTLKPYYKNFGKRLTKTPKVYFTETGLVAYLLGLTMPEQVARDPLMGNLFENMVVSDLLKSRLNAGRSPDMYFFRDLKGFEVDIILEEGGALQPIEIKSSSTFNVDFAKGLKTFSTIAEKVIHPTVIYSGNTLKSETETSFLNFTEIGS